MSTVISPLHALLLIRVVLTVSCTVAHMLLVYAFLPMSALELVCLDTGLGQETDATQG